MTDVLVQRVAREVCGPCRAEGGRGARPRRWSGFTLVEVVMAIAVTSVIFAAIGSAMVLTARAVPGTGPTDAVLRASRTLDELTGDLRFALAFTERTNTAVTFTVPDRTGDGVNETIRYAWSGTAGGELTRAVNGGDAVAIADNVQAFSLDYHIEQQTTTTSTPVESHEMLLDSQTGLLLLFGFSVSSSHWPGQYFKPSLPGDALSWRVTRVFFLARDSGTRDGRLYVQLRAPTINKTPSHTVIDQVVIDESSLPSSFQWQNVAFNNAEGFSPNMGLCLVLQGAPGSGTPAQIRYSTGLSLLSNLNMVQTTNSGSSWSFFLLDSMHLYVYGTVTRPGPTVTTHTRRVTSVDASLRLDAAAHTLVSASVRTLNEPEVSP